MTAARTAPPAPTGILLDPLERCSRHRRFSAPIVRLLMANAELREVGRKIGNCAQTLDLLMEQPPDGDLYAHLMGANCCKQRMCPWCEWRRSLRWQRRVYEGLEALAVEQPKLRPVLLTVTVRNCEIGALGDTLKEMHTSWRRFAMRKFFPSDLWFRKTEVTYPSRLEQATAQGRLQSSGDDELPEHGRRWAHPHVHALLMVPPSYFSHGYVKALTWQQEWMTAAKLDYVPVVDVRAVTAAASSRLAGNINLAAAMEVGKYITKASDYQQLGALVPEVYHQIRGHRMIGVSHAMRQYIPEHEPTDEELTDQPVRMLSANSTFQRCAAHWNEAAQEYWLAVTEGAA